MTVKKEMIIFKSSIGNMVWDYTEISVAKINSLWYYGIRTAGMCYGCSEVNHKSFETEEKAIEFAYRFLKNRMENKGLMDLGFKHNGHKQLKEMIEWWRSKDVEQLKLFQE